MSLQQLFRPRPVINPVPPLEDAGCGPLTITEFDGCAVLTATEDTSTTLTVVPYSGE